MPKEKELKKSMEIIEKSGVLNPDMNMKQIMDLTKEMDEVIGPGIGDISATTFIYKHFIYKTDADMPVKPDDFLNKLDKRR